MQKQIRKIVSFATAAALLLAGVAAPWGTNEAQAAKKAKLKTKKNSSKGGENQEDCYFGKG